MLLITLQTSNPDIFGIITSSNIKSKCFFSTKSKASLPLEARYSIYFSDESWLERIYRFIGSSSTNRIENLSLISILELFAKSIVTSPLVKSALFGADPNWGRIAAAVGYSGADMDEKMLTITLESSQQKVEIVKNGSIKAFEGSPELDIAEEIMGEEEIKITVDLSLGEYEATAFGCDLTYDYVRINAEYST